MLISIIVPVYYGKKYINDLIMQVEKCASYIEPEEKVQLILSNDAPDDKIEESYISEIIDIVILNTDVNTGIHGARVRGLEESHAEFVVFLDQDDKIFPEYLRSQLKNIHDADAVVCRLIHEKKQYYTNTNLFEGVLEYERMISIGNQIVSPGQVLIRRTSIPRIWKQNIMQHNGADDWLLWLCMIAKDKKFMLNQEILFEHVVNGKNVSWDSALMFQSEDEVYDILLKEKAFGDKQLEKLFNAIRKKQLKHIRKLEAVRERFYLYDKWITLENKKGSIVRFLKKKGYEKIAIYGVGDIGKQLIGKLYSSAEHMLVGAIDRNAKYIKSDIYIATLEEFGKDVDLVIVALIGNSKNIIGLIQQKVDAEVFTFEELLEIWERE